MRKTPAMLPKHQCSYVAEVWGPHPGCAEFMDGPECVYQCESPATHQGKLDIPYIGREKVILCGFHAKESDETFYRYRTIR